ncbi:single-stranded DNA-binding protein [Skermanella stibiiresistens SB22]|uniref:SsrA-binding protein n=1 Tax=Skermanella stibiiresistens SB22 TaxID=1385369 RepID=W9H5X0_9PROT|nr:SsrA-binding protein SmpB [Skermanella stibiiresistens]EWY40186.1 single-stranded DNA-binding protein [Skermanella stibiiresistens SB22]
MAQPGPVTSRMVAQNRRARFDYFIDDTLEAGIALLGTEVKSLRSGKASIGESYAGAQNGGLYLVNSYIPEYQLAGQYFQHEPKRPRKLLVHKREMNKMMGAMKRDGVTIVPLSIYFNARGIAKVELGIARGKKKVDKRASEKERDWQRDKARVMRGKGKDVD